MSKENKTKSKWIKPTIIIMIPVVIVLLLWLWLRPKETHISGGEQTSNIASLKCSIGSSEDAFFQSASASNIKHEIRNTFKDNQIANISYIFNATYPSKSAAETANAVLHGQYNKYMGSNNISGQSLHPDFATIDTEVQISLYVDKSKLNNLTLPFFFLDADDYQRLGTRSIEDTRKLYENKGFKCKTNN